MPRTEEEILSDVKALAVEYYVASGKPLGVTDEVAEVEATRLLGLTLAGARSEGFDATRQKDGQTEFVQVKGRWKRDGTKWGRVPSSERSPTTTAPRPTGP